MAKPNPFRRFRTPPEIIRLAVMLYVWFPLSLRNVEDLLHERGVDVSHETVRHWWHRFGPKRRIEGMRSSQWRWHLDEMFVKINSEIHYLWRAVDHEGEILESFVTKTRDKKAALKFLRKSMKTLWPTSGVLVTEKLRSYCAAIREIGNDERQETGRWLQQSGLRILTCRSDDENGQCCVSGGYEVLQKCSLPFTPPCRTTSTRNAASSPATSSSRTEPPLSQNGANLARRKGRRHCPTRGWFALV